MSDNPSPLLPCPFCGNKANIVMANEKHDHSGGYFIACPVCDASTGLRYAMGDDPRPLLVEQWNRRAAIEANTLAAPDVDALANFIREIDGAHRFGAGALAERICEWLAAAPQPQPVAQPSNCRHCGGPDNVLCAGQCKPANQQKE